MPDVTLLSRPQHAHAATINKAWRLIVAPGSHTNNRPANVTSDAATIMFRPRCSRNNVAARITVATDLHVQQKRCRRRGRVHETSGQQCRTDGAARDDRRRERPPVTCQRPRSGTSDDPPRRYRQRCSEIQQTLPAQADACPARRPTPPESTHRTTAPPTHSCAPQLDSRHHGNPGTKSTCAAARHRVDPDSRGEHRAVPTVRGGYASGCGSEYIWG